MSGGCPTDTFLSNATVCRGSADVCDAAEFCTGLSTVCPPDSFEPSSTTCRAATGECDIAEQCSGSSPSCSSDSHISGGTPCTSDGSICTTDQCNGAGLCVHPDNGTCENSSVNLPPGGTISSDTENDGATPSDISCCMNGSVQLSSVPNAVTARSILALAAASSSRSSMPR